MIRRRRLNASICRARSRRLFFEGLETRALLATVATDDSDYAPGETPLITASGFQTGETVQFQVLHNDGTPNTGNGHSPWQVTDGSPDDFDGLVDGNIVTMWYVDPDDSANSAFDLTATGQSSGLIASATFTDSVVVGSVTTNLRSASESSTSPATFAHTVPVGDNRLLVVSVMVEGNESVSGISGITFNGDALTFQVRQTSGGNESDSAVEIWTLVAPDEVSADVVVTFSSNATPWGITATNFTGVDQILPIGATAGNSGNNGDVSVSLNNYSAGSLVFGAATKDNEDVTSFSPNSGTEHWDVATGSNDDDLRIWGASITTGTVGTHALSATPQTSTSGDWAMAAIEIRMAGPANPPFPALACDLDIVLVVDVSGSISGTEYAEIVAAITAFVNAFDSDAVTQFALVAFNSDGAVVHNFTDVGSDIIDALDPRPDPGDQFTNWDIGMYLARNLFVAQNALPGRGAIPDTIVFASDGNPNRFGGTAGGHTGVLGHPGSIIDPADDDQALAAGIDEANAAKAAGIRIIAVGVGEDVSIDSLQAISGPSVSPPFVATTDVVSASFPGLAQSLVDLADALCPKGKITVVKDALPNDLADFTFSRNFGANFLLDDDAGVPGGDNTSLNSAIFENIIPGTYTVTEETLAGWSLTNLVINDPDNGSSIDLVTRTATIDVDINENITVTFTNTKDATVTLIKNSIGGDDTFDFDASGLFPSDVDITTVGGTGNQVFTFSNLPAGGQAASITELQANLPAGWNFSNLQVTGDDDSSIAGQTATLNVEPGENIVITYANTKQATVRVVKDTIGGDDSFDFDGTGLLPADLDITTVGGTGSSSTFTFNNLPASGSAASVTELLANLPAGWNFTNLQVTGDDDSSVVNQTATLNVEPGENIVITYANTKQATVRVVKNTIGGDDSFDFDGTGLLPADLDITTAGGTGSSSTFTFNNLPASGSAASVTELLANLPAGWNFTNLQVTGDDDSSVVNQTATLNVEPGENIVITYANTKQATVRVVKNTIGGDDTFDFDGTGLLTADLDITTAGGTGSSSTFTFNNLPASGSAASVTELLANIPAGWNFTNLQVSGDDDSNIAGQTATLNVEPGENIVITFTNTKQATVRVVKDTIGGDDTFDFDGTGLLPADLDITTAGGTGSSSTFTFNNLPASGSAASMTELLANLPAGWNFTNLQVTGDDDSSVADQTATLNVEPGENIVITYANTKQATVRVVKNTIGGDDTFDFDGTGLLTADLDITTAGGTGSSSTFTFNNLPASGSAASVTELLANIPAGWNFTNLQVSGDDDSNIAGQTATLNVEPGENIVITYTNTKQATVRVVKNTIGGDDSFDFDGTGLLPADLDITTAGGTGSSTFTFNNLPAGGSAASVTELLANLPAGWNFTNLQVTGDDDSSVVNQTATLNVEPGENIVITYTNNRQASITIVKDAIGGNDTFEFDGTGLLPADFDLTTVGGTASQTFSFDVPANGSAASVTELLSNLPASWNFTSLQVAGDDDAIVSGQTATLNLEPGENITVTYSNTRQATVRVVKSAIGGDATFQFDVGGQLIGQGSPVVPDPQDITTVGGAGQSSLYTFSNLPVGGQSLSFDELSLAGWTFTSVIVSGDAGHSIVGDIATLDVDPGETIVVTYTDTKDATVQVVKNTIGGNDAFDFDGSGRLPADFDITTTGGTGSSSTFTFSNLPAIGSAASVAELLANLPAGWSFTNLQVAGDDDSSVAGQTATLNVEPGETIVVTFTNTKDATVRVVKNAIGGNDSFDFDGTGLIPADFDIATVAGTGDQLFTFNDLPASGQAASVTELLANLPAGWNFTNLQVAGDDDSSIANQTAALNVEPGENIIITYTNTKQATVRVVKNTIGGDDTFDFDVDGALNGQGSPAVPDPLSITTVGGSGQSSLFTFDNLPASGQSLSFNESLLSGWILSGLQIAGGDADDTTAGTTATLNVEPGETIVVTYTNTRLAQDPGVIVIGPDKTNASLPYIHVVNSETGELLTRFLAYEESFRGGVRLATGDVTGDNIAEIIVAPGRGHIPNIKIFDQSGNLLREFLAFSSSFVSGVDIAVGDVDGDGWNEIVAAQNYNGSQVKVFRNTQNPTPTFSLLGSSFYPFGSSYKGGATVELADMGTPTSSSQLDSTQPDGKAELIIASETGKAPTIQVRGYFGAATTPTVMRTFTPFTPTFRGGMSLDVAPVGLNDLVPDIIVGAGNGGQSQVQILDGVTGAVIGNFFAFTPGDTTSYNAPLDVSAVDSDSNGFAEAILVCQGSDGIANEIRKFDSQSGTLLSALPESAFDTLFQATPINDYFGAYFVAPLVNTAPPIVEVQLARAGLTANLLPYGPTYFGGVSVATGDLNGDGVDEIVTGPQRNYAPWVRIFDQDGNMLHQFLAYGSTFKGGVDVALGDINGDGKLDIATSMLSGGNQVKTFKNVIPVGAAVLPKTSFSAHSNFKPFGDSFKGGAEVELADMGRPVTVSGKKTLNSTQFDGRAEVIVANRAGMRSTVKTYAYFGTSTTATSVRTLLPLNTTFRGGLSLDVGDVNGDNVPDVIVGAGRGGASQVQVLDGSTGSVLNSFQAFGASEFNYNAPLEVEAHDSDFDGVVDALLAAHDFDGKSREVRRFQPLTGELVDAFFQDNFKV